MKLHVVGSGVPDPRGERYGYCFVLEIAERMLMFDCGPASTYKLARMGIAPGRIERLFFTHHHFDHNVDYPCFLLSRWDQDSGATPTLRVYGPKTTERLTDRLIGEQGAFVDDWRSRIEHPASRKVHEKRGGSLPRPAPIVEVADVKGGLVDDEEDWRVTAAAVHHVEPCLQSLAYRVETSEGSVAVTGDAGPCQELDNLCRDADVFVICCAYHKGLHPDTADVVTGVGDVARMARELKPKTVILTHTTRGLAGPGRREAAVAEVARGFDGRVIFADELTTLTIP